MRNKKIQDADVSNAGDDFHVLWTMQKSYDLLNFNDCGLKAINIEGVEKAFAKKYDSSGEKLLGIDLSEYYGGKDFYSANKIIVSQLKYSTKKANDLYNFSTLYRNSKNNSHDGSIIHRLANIFKTFLEAYSRNDIIRKVRIKLVSNRNMNLSQLNVLYELSTLKNGSKPSVSLKSLIRNPSIKYKKSLIKFYEATDLNEQDFFDFIKILDFEDCGTNSRQGLKIELIKAISETSITYQANFNALYLMIWQKCMPESDNNRLITEIDLINALGFDGGLVENLFPVDQGFLQSKYSIKREQLNDILDILNKQENRIVCIHGGAGIGKSTIVQQIQKHLPEYSESILFDCYGKGAYQYDSDKRHLPKNAILQLANELAKKVGTSFLINREAADDIYIKEFEKRLEKAVEILIRRDQRATLNIIIDAADNSIVAAHLHNEAHFISQLTNFKIPDGCNIIFTTRTYRKNSLKLPEKHKEFVLRPFSIAETTTFLKQHFPNVSQKNIENFHRFTDGNPRSQYYALDLKLNGIKEVINYLKPNGKTVEDFILDKIQEAEKRLGETEKHLIRDFLGLLIVLPRPVPVNYLAHIMNVNENFLIDLKSEIWTGLIYDNNQFEFRDEDFENFIRQNYAFNIIERPDITKVFLHNASNEFYAAKSLGFILYNSARYEELKQIVLRKQFLESIVDPIRKKEIYIQRVQQAIKLSKAEKDYLTLYKLLLIAAEEAKTDQALSNLLINHPELVLHFGDEHSLQKFKLSSEKTTWGGSFHLKLAGAYSSKNKEVSLRNLKTAHEWLRWESENRERLKKDYENRNHYNIFSSDIAGEFETLLRIYGLETALRSLYRWKPKSLRLDVGNQIFEKVFAHTSKETITNWIKDIPNQRIDVKIFLLTKLFHYNKKFQLNVIGLGNEFLRFKHLKFGKDFNKIIIDFCEILLFHRCEKIILKIIDSIKSETLNHIPYFQNQFIDKKDHINMDLVLRIYIIKCLIGKKSLALKEIYPDHYKEVDKIEDYKKRRSKEREKEEFDNFYSIALPIYKLRIRFFQNTIPHIDLIKEFQAICKQIEDRYDYDYKAGYRAQEQKLFFVKKLSEILCLLQKESLIRNLINSFSKVPYKDIRFTILNRTKIFKNFDDANLQLLSEIEKKCEEIITTSQNLVDDYIQCSKLSINIDPNIGKHFFEKAIDAVQEIEYYEAFAKIRCIYHLTTVGIGIPDPKLAYSVSRFIEYCNLSLDGYDKKHFPFEIGIISVGNLHFPSLFTTLSRWHHRDIIEIQNYAFTMLDQAVKKNFLDHKEAAALLPLYQHNFHNKELIQFYKKLLRKFDEKMDMLGKSAFVKQLFVQYRLAKDRQILNEIYEEIKSGAFVKTKILEEVRLYLEFLEGLETKKDTAVTHLQAHQATYQYPIEDIDVLSSKELESAIAKISEQEESYGRSKVDQFLNDIQYLVPTSGRIEHLNALLAIDHNILDYYSLENALDSRFMAWSNYPLIKDWKRQNFKNIITSRYSHFNEDSRFNLYSIRNLAEKFELSEEILTENLIDLLPDIIETLSDETIYDLFELLKSNLNLKNSELLLRWALDRWSEPIKPEVADGIWKETLLPPENKNQVISEFLRFLLGHPIKSIRWRAVHSTINLVQAGNLIILKNLFANQNLTDCSAFQNSGFPFYWISAKLYLWIAIDRISIKSPGFLIEQKQYFLKEMENENLPHILIRFLARKSALKIQSFEPNFLNTNEINRIQISIKSHFKKVYEESLTREQRKYNDSENKNWRFKFDRLDTLPYSYSSLARIFNLSEFDVADIADQFIVEHWGYTGNIDKDDYIFNQISRSDYSSMRDRYLNPPIESLQTYFEYHAMLCAATILLENEPQLQDSYRDWNDWLCSQALTWNNYWISDLVDPVPLKRKFWKLPQDNFNTEWRDNIPDLNFVKEIGLIEKFENSFILPHGNYKRYLGQNTEDVYIRSALVFPETASALLRSLNNLEDHFSYSFPIEQNNERPNEIEKDKFKLLSWIKYIDGQAGEEGLDQEDYLYRPIGYSIPVLGSNILDLFSIRINPNLKSGTYNNRIIMKNVNWNEVSEDRYRDRTTVESEGHLLYIDFDLILSILKKTGNYLIIKCKIERQLEEREYGYDKNGRPWEKTKLFLLKDDGTYET